MEQQNIKIYTAPDAELLIIQFEENILSANSAGSGYGNNNLGELTDPDE